MARLLRYDEIDRIKEIYKKHQKVYNAEEVWGVYREDIKDRINKDVFIAICEKDNEIISIATLALVKLPINKWNYKTSGVCGEISFVHTLQEYRCNGYAEKCLIELISIANSKGINYIYLWSTSIAERLYRKLGFKEEDNTVYLEIYKEI